MANGGGSINLRMSLQGAEQVKAELASIGPAGSKMARDLDRAMRTPAPGLKALDSGTREVRTGMEGLAGRLGPVGSGLSALGGIGLGVAAALAAVAAGAAMALNQARAAAQWADEIEDSAAKINIGVEALQEWRYAAQEAGGEASDADSAIDSFQKKLGEGLAGGRSVKWFERLGFGKDDLKNFGSTEAALDAVIDKIAGLGTEAERAAVAEKLGLGPLIPLVREGSDAIEGMRQRARDLGIVMEEDMVKRGAEASREMEVLSQKIDMQLKQAFIDLGPSIIWVMGLVGQLASALNGLANSWKAFEQKSSDYLQKEDQRLSRGITSLLTRAGANSPDELSPSERTLFNRMNDRRGRIAAEIGGRATETAAAPAPVPPATLIDVTTRRAGGGGGGGDRAARDAERRAQERQRALDAVATARVRAERQMLQAQFGPGGPEESRLELGRGIVTLEKEEADARRAALRAQLEKADALDDVRLAELEELRLIDARLATMEDDALLREDQRERAEAQRAAEDAYLQVTSEILSLASSQARSSDERRAIELRLLDIAQNRERIEREAEIAAAKEGPARDRLVDALNMMTLLHKNQRDAVALQNSGPVDQWRDSQLQGAGEIGEHLQGAALDALDSVNEGLRDAWKNAESASDAFAAMGDVAVDALGRVVDALLEVAIERMLIEPLVNGIFGAPGGKGGGGGLLGSFLGNITGSFMGGGIKPGTSAKVIAAKGLARGGLVGATGLYPVGEEDMELVELPGGARVHDAHRTNAILSGMDSRLQSGGGGTSPAISLTANVINQKKEPVTATVRQTPDGVDVILRPMVRAEVARMGGDGTLARVQAMTPRGIKR